LFCFQGLVRIAKCSIALGDVAAAENALTRAAEIEPGNTTLNSDMASVQSVRHHLEESRKAEEKGDYRKVCTVSIIHFKYSCDFIIRYRKE
jgi:hypothetical protein